MMILRLMVTMKMKMPTDFGCTEQPSIGTVLAVVVLPLKE